MTTQDLLCDRWGVWLNYYLTEEEQKNADYNDTIKHQHTLQTHHDFITFWSLSPLSDLRNYFVYESEPNKNMWTSYEIDGKTRNINAINYFREGIKPTWQDPKNATGARLIFQIDREHENHQDIYQWLVFYFIGEDFQHSEQINGIRFISSRFNAPLKFHFRVEIWVTFNEEALEQMARFRDLFLQKFHEKFNIKNFKPYFKDNK